LPWANANGVPCKNIDELCASDAARKLFQKEIAGAAAASGLHKFEIPKAIMLKAEPMSVENGLLTPTFKAKRNDVKKLYEKEIAAMYLELKE
jgi:long-chain acyl-CoA synthetase